MYQLNRDKQEIVIENKSYSRNDFRIEALPEFASKSDFHHKLALFLKDWFSDSSKLNVQTSGSTGAPQQISVEKERMIQSAHLTCSFLGLETNNTALLCMSLDYIGGKMMVVRALVANLNLIAIAPCGNPLKDVSTDLDFVAMTPMQVYNSLQNMEERDRLANISNLIIGGGGVDNTLQKALIYFPNKIYSTYGMTETLSHIALQRINGANASDSYQPFDSVHLSLSEDNTLIIDAPLVNSVRLYTNDVVEIHDDGSFKVLGRKDNIINSGGIKIQIEVIENLLKPAIHCPFAISSLPDPKFGEIVVLVTEQHIDKEELKKVLPPYATPKKIFIIEKIPLTETNKISRREVKNILHQFIGN